MQNIYDNNKSNIKVAAELGQDAFYLLVESVKDYAIYMTDPEGNIISWNKGAEKIKGYTAEEVLGKNISIFYTEEAIAKKECENNLKKAVEKGRFETEGWRVCKDGSLFWADVVFTALLDEQGDLKGFAKVTRDITKQKKIENEIIHLNETLEKRVAERTEELLKSEKKFHDLFQNNPMAMWVIDSASSKILDVNEAAIRHYGYSRSEFLSMTALDIRPDSDKERYIRLEESTQHVSYYAGLWRHLKKDGTVITVEVSADDITFEGKPARIILSNDVTEKRKIAENLQDSLREVSDYKYALDESSIVAITDQKGIIKYANKNFRYTSGYNTEELVGHDHRIINSDYHSKEFFRNLWVTIASGKIWRGEIKNKAKDGSIFWVYSTIVPFLDEQDKPYQYVSINTDITDRKNAEEEKTKSEERYRNTLDHMLEGVEIIGFDWRFIYVNNAFEEQVNLSKSQLLGYTILEKFPGIEKTQVFKNIALCFKERNSIQFEDELTFPGNITKWFEMSFQPVPEGVFILSVDVTKRKKAEEKVLKLNEEISTNEKRFRGLIENSQDIVALFNPDLHSPYFYQSPSTNKVTGWTDEEIQKSGALDLVHPNDISLVKKFTLDVLSNPGTPIPINLRFRHKQGHYISFEGIMTNMMQDESINGIVINLRDVTEKKEAEEKLIRSERIYKTIASSIPGSVICIIDCDHRYLLIEGDMLAKLGYTKEQLLRNKLPDVLPPARYAQLLPDLERVFAGELFTIESDQSGYHIVTRFVPLKDENDNVYAAMLVLIDVTELKKAERHILELNVELEQKVIKRTEELEAANKELEAFSYSVSHDLRAPLRAVNGYAKILEDDYFKVFDEEGKRLLRTVQLNAKRMGVLIDDLLAFSRLGRKEVNKSLVRMTELTKNVVFELVKDLPTKIEIMVNELHPVLADYSLMTQVMTNLLSNAIKYSAKKENPVVKVVSEKKGNEIIYSVSDNGAGFDMQYAHKLFGVFQRLHSTEFEGTGVGLAIVQRIIVRHGGKIWAESELEKGATFYFSLPVN